MRATSRDRSGRRRTRRISFVHSRTKIGTPDRFLLASPNTYNSLRLGTTQLYDKTVVYNHKRHGDFQLGSRTFVFRVKPRFPKSLTKEFLLVDLVNNLDQLAEPRDKVLKRVTECVAASDGPRLRRAVHEYASEWTKKLFDRALGER